MLEIIERLHKDLQIPVFHDDQHRTAVITLAALINALRLLHKEMNTIKVVIAVQVQLDMVYLEYCKKLDAEILL